MKRDLDSRAEIEKMIQLFYEKVKVDPQIGFFFNDIVKVNWEKHLPIMYDFWESIILGNNTYSGNPIEVHSKLNQLSPLKKEHFKRWLELFEKNLDENFAGKYTEIARQRAMSVAMVMELKMKNK